VCVQLADVGVSERVLAGARQQQRGDARGPSKRDRGGCENLKPIMRCSRQSYCVDGEKAIQLSNFTADAETLKQWPVQWLLRLLKIGGFVAS